MKHLIITQSLFFYKNIKKNGEASLTTDRKTYTDERRKEYN